jgi:hypothetical protein
MSYQKSFFLALLIMAAVTLIVGLPRWLCRKYIGLE